MSRLPRVMVAPNGARRGVADHAALPITIPQIVAEARACFAAGAHGIHAHVRDSAGKHTLDAGLYSELLAELASAVPDMVVQITTESVGQYSADEQMDLVRSLRPVQVSIAAREITVGQSDQALSEFFHWANDAKVGVQHILYSDQDVQQLETLVARNIIPANELEVIFVLGQYGGTRDSEPDDLTGFMAQRRGALAEAGWAVCAFGRNETACLVAAMHQGGKARIGFENNLFNADGSLATSNAERVEELMTALGQKAEQGASKC